MDEDSRMGRISELRTLGVGTFSEGEGGELFRVEPGHSAAFVLEQATLLMSCAQKLSLEASVEQDFNAAWAAHYLTGMAKALVQDLAHGLMVST